MTIVQVLYACSGPTTHVIHNWFFLQIYHKYDDRSLFNYSSWRTLQTKCFVLYLKHNFNLESYALLTLLATSPSLAHIIIQLTNFTNLALQ